MILIVNKTYYPEIGGVEVVAKTIADCMSENKKVLVLSFNTRGKYEENTINNVDVIRLPVALMPIAFKKNPVRISHLYKKEFLRISRQSECVLFNFPSGQPELYSKLYKKISSKKICFYHADIVEYGFVGRVYNEIFAKRFLDAMDEIIVTSPNIVETSQILKHYRDKIRVIPLFVDIAHFYPRFSNKREYLINLFGSKKINKLIMYVGRLACYKGLEYLIKAVNYLDDSYGLVIIGQGSKQKELEVLIRELSLKDRVVSLQHVSYKDLPEYYSSADVFVLPSINRAEAFGLVALEAMACGTPIITTELGTGTSYYNINGETGMVVPPRDVNALVEAINEICKGDWKSYRKDILVTRSKEFSLDIFKSSITEVLN